MVVPKTERSAEHLLILNLQTLFNKNEKNMSALKLIGTKSIQSN